MQHGRRGLAIVERDREHLVFVGFEQELKGSAVALLAGFDNPSINKLFSHHHL